MENGCARRCSAHAPGPCPAGRTVLALAREDRQGPDLGQASMDVVYVHANELEAGQAREGAGDGLGISPATPPARTGTRTARPGRGRLQPAGRIPPPPSTASPGWRLWLPQFPPRTRAASTGSGAGARAGQAGRPGWRRSQARGVRPDVEPGQAGRRAGRALQVDQRAGPGPRPGQVPAPLHVQPQGPQRGQARQHVGHAQGGFPRGKKDLKRRAKGKPSRVRTHVRGAGEAAEGRDRARGEHTSANREMTPGGAPQELCFLRLSIHTHRPRHPLFSLSPRTHTANAPKEQQMSRQAHAHTHPSSSSISHPHSSLAVIIALASSRPTVSDGCAPSASHFLMADAFRLVSFRSGS